ncbi:TIGR02449 family protein [Lysobacter sp. CA199]|uniref:TIGR02449 family protein n=1 Tax=Lysobacter sp. CA199 TaxID=3455608 RepID=UPI003F8CFF94
MTAPAPACHRAGMDRAELIVELQSLLTRADELGDRVRKLSEENRSLRQQQEQLVGERSALLAKNEQARTRVEAMIARLKSLEQHT